MPVAGRRVVDMIAEIADGRGQTAFRLEDLREIGPVEERHGHFIVSLQISYPTNPRCVTLWYDCTEEAKMARQEISECWKKFLDGRDDSE